MTSITSITCPVCGMTSHNIDDVRYGYCGKCHTFTSEGWSHEDHEDHEDRGNWRIKRRLFVLVALLIPCVVAPAPWSWVALVSMWVGVVFSWKGAFRAKYGAKLSGERLTHTILKTEMFIRGELARMQTDETHLFILPWDALDPPPPGHFCFPVSAYLNSENGTLTYRCACGAKGAPNSKGVMWWDRNTRIVTEL